MHVQEPAFRMYLNACQMPGVSGVLVFIEQHVKGEDLDALGAVATSSINVNY